jgi:hypothetical protein
MTERRSQIDRRHLELVPEPLERYDQRRVGEERRNSPRFPMRLWVADALEGGVPAVYEAEMSLGGASWWTRYPPIASEVDVHFRLSELHEHTAHARVLRILEDGTDRHVQVQFTDMSLKTELALARYLEAQVHEAKAALEPQTESPAEVSSVPASQP